MNPVYPLLALTIGLVVPLQAAINNQLKAVIGGSTILAALVSFAIGTLALLAVACLTGQKMSGLLQLPRVEWWMLLGGILGALFVFGTTFLAPRIGVAAMLSLIIAGQILASLLFDRLGLLGMPLRDINGWRLAGAVLVIAGVLLVNFGDRLGAAK